MVKMLTTLVSTVSNSQLFLLKNVSSFCKSSSHFFSKNISIYAIFNDQSFNDTNDIVSFEQLGPEFQYGYQQPSYSDSCCISFVFDVFRHVIDC